jgi:hypothetical protein
MTVEHSTPAACVSAENAASPGPLTWSQRAVMRMVAEGRSPSGGSSYLDTTGMGIPGSTLRSLRKRGLIEPRSFLEDRTWVLTKAGHEAIANGECLEPEDLVAAAREAGQCSDPTCEVRAVRQSYAAHQARDPWDASNYLGWCVEHAPVGAWAIVASEVSTEEVALSVTPASTMERDDHA